MISTLPQNMGFLFNAKQPEFQLFFVISYTRLKMLSWISTVNIDSAVRSGNQVYKTVWHPTVGELLAVFIERDNIHDRHAIGIDPLFAAVDRLHHHYASIGFGETPKQSCSEGSKCYITWHQRYLLRDSCVNSTPMNRCKLCVAHILDSNDRRQLSSLSLECCDSLLVDLACESGAAKKDVTDHFSALIPCLGC